VADALSDRTAHLSCALAALKPGADVMREPWPKVDESALVQDEIELVLQVNGNSAGICRGRKQAGREQLEQLASRTTR